MKFFQLTPSQAAEQLNTDLMDGLSLSQVEYKQTVCGKNEFKKNKNKSLFSRFLAQFKDYMIIILLLSAVILAVVALLEQKYLELAGASAIMAIVIVNGLIGLLHEHKVRATLAVFEKYDIHKSLVIRQGNLVEILREELVPGDIVLLQTGDVVPADGRIMECSFFKVDESILSGKSLPAEKSIEAIEGDNHPVEDLHNMVFSGTTVVSGNAKIIVTAIGNETQIGKISGMLSLQEETRAPLQTQMTQMGKVLSLIALVISTILLILGIIEGKAVVEMFLTVVSLAVASMPEGLTATLTVLLALGMQQLVDSGVVARKLGTVEMLGNIDVICTDKTGILTKNEMRVSSCYVKGETFKFIPKNYKDVAEIILYASMCNDAKLSQQDDFTDSTEAAIISALSAFGKNKEFLDKQYPRMGTIPFDRERKCKSTIHIVNGRNLVVVKGSPEQIYCKCKNLSTLDDIVKIENEMASFGWRVLAVAVREVDVIPSELLAEEIEQDLTLIGLIGLTSVPDPATVAALQECRNAGIKTIMISGDYVVTAKATAERLGIYSEGDITLTGELIDAMSDDEFSESVKNCSVYSRISSEQKVRLVQAWQKFDKNVIITGETVDDASALQKADIGCVMGVTGVDSVRNAADVVFADGGFAAIVSAIRQGRGVYNNIKKTIGFLLTGNLSEVLLLFISMLFMFQLPILPLHLLWINVFTNALPALTLGMEKARQGLMTHPPRSKNESLITMSVSIDILWQSALIAVVALLGFLIGTGFVPRTNDQTILSVGQTMAFAILALSQIFHVFNRRSKHLILKIGFFANKYINFAASISVLLLMFVMLMPGVSSVFGISSLSFLQWLLIILLSLVPFAVCEAVKIIRKSK